MTKAQELMSIIEAQHTPCQIKQQVEILSYIKQNIEMLKSSREALVNFHLKDGINDMLSDDAKKLDLEIKHIMKEITGAV